MTWIVASKGSSWWSRLICWTLGNEPVSHISILHTPYVYHSDLLGVRRERRANYFARQVTTHVLRVPEFVDIELKYREHQHSWYDIGACLFLGLSFLARRYMKVPLPKSNLWQTTGMFMCTEWVTEGLGEVDSMITPWQLFKKLEEVYGKNQST